MRKGWNGIPLTNASNLSVLLQAQPFVIAPGAYDGLIGKLIAAV
jgi:hypothetical protein